jgi:hypothetical protein
MGRREKVSAGKAQVKSQIQEAVRPFLEPGEQLVECAYVDKGPGPWALGMLGQILFWKHYSVSLTDRRLLLVRTSVTGNPKGLDFADLRTGVSVTRYVKHSMLSFSALCLRRPDGSKMRLNTRRGTFGGWDTSFRPELLTIRRLLKQRGLSRSRALPS